MPAPTEALPFSKMAPIVTFTWGDDQSHAARYARWDNDVEVEGGQIFYSEMRMQVEPGKIDGGIKDTPWKIVMPARNPLDKMIRKTAWAPVTAYIEFIDPSATPMPRRLMYKGIVSKTWKNRSGFKGLVQAEVSGPRSLIQYPVGLQINPQCPWTLFDKNCCVDSTLYQVSRTVEDIVDKTLIQVGSLEVPEEDPHYWSFGEVYLDGLAISIIDGSLGDGYLRLLHPPPLEWGGASVVIKPGCDKYPRTCHFRFNNLARYGGMGWNMPSKNPILGTANDADVDTL